MNVEKIQYLCDKYKIKYKIFEVTNYIYLDSGLDEWLVKYQPGREKPFCLMHKNKIKQTKKYHVQRYLRTEYQLIDCVANHKKILVNMFHGSHNTYKKNKNRINNINCYTNITNVKY